MKRMTSRQRTKSGALKPVAAASLALGVLGPALTGWGFPWDKDMVNQPTAKPQRMEIPPPPTNAIPISGTETLPAPTTEQGMFDAKEDAASLPNPVPATAESVARGRALYATTCLVCHGPEGRGDGPVGQAFDPTPMDLNDSYTQDQADGQIFFTLTRGRGAMPFYRDVLTQEERWDVVNYIKQEFGPQ